MMGYIQEVYDENDSLKNQLSESKQSIEQYRKDLEWILVHAGNNDAVAARAKIALKRAAAMLASHKKEGGE